MASLVSYKDFCIDVNSSRPAAEFWAATLGLQAQPDGHGGGEFMLVGPTPQHTVWLNEVPERKEVKNRVHVDIAAGSFEPFEHLRRLSVMGQFPWTVLADPEDHEFCVFVVDDAPDYRMKSLVVDCADPKAVATWWHDLLGGTLGSEEEHDWHWVTDVPGMPFEGFDFVPVPEPKTVKNRVHWDVTLNEGVGIDALEAAGAAVLRLPDDEIRWTVMADPEGNEFCVFGD